MNVRKRKKVDVAFGSSNKTNVRAVLSTLLALSLTAARIGKRWV